MGVSYLTATAKGEKGGAVLLQQARLKELEVVLVLSIVCNKDGAEERRIIKEWGEWFQNTAARRALEMLKLGKTSEMVIDHLINERKKEAGCTVFFGIDNQVVFFGDEKSRAYLLVSQFGKRKLQKIEFEEKNEVLAYEIDNKATVLIMDSDVDTSLDVAECVDTADSQKTMDRAVLEISQSSGDISIACLKLY